MAKAMQEGIEVQRMTNCRWAAMEGVGMSPLPASPDLWWEGFTTYTRQATSTRQKVGVSLFAELCMCRGYLSHRQHAAELQRRNLSGLLVCMRMVLEALG